MKVRSHPIGMTTRHTCLALLVALIWGSNFVFIRLGLNEAPPLTFLALRFAAVAIPAVLFVPPPTVSWRLVVLIGLATNLGQFVLAYSAMAHGMPTGLVGVVLQVQVLFTAVLAALHLHENPGRSGWIGMGVGCFGLAILAAFRGGNTPLLGVVLTVAAGLSWAIGNVAARRAKAPGLPLVVWSGVAALPGVIVLALVFEGPTSASQAVMHLSWQSWACTGYTAVVSTLIGYGLWNHLLRTNPAHLVTRFALLIPAVSLAAAWLAFSETPSVGELVGSVVIVVGVCMTTFLVENST